MTKDERIRYLDWMCETARKHDVKPETEFLIREVDAEITFIRDGAGQVQKLMKSRGTDLRCN